MWKRIAAYIGIILSLAVLITSTSRTCMSYLYNYKNGIEETDKWYAPYHSKAGDLTAISYLQGIDRFYDTTGYIFKKPAQDSCRHGVHMMLYGDSYTMHIPDSAFACVSNYQYGRRGYSKISFDADSGQKHILIIEIGERFLRDFFSGIYMFDQVVQKYKTVHTSRVSKEDTVTVALQQQTAAAFSVDSLFNKNINQNIEQNVFNYNLLTGFRTTKAAINFLFFNRASGDVSISDNRQYLFIKESVEKTGNGSSYSEVSEKELYNIVTNINTIWDSYTQRGVGDVYLAIIPNPSSILQPEGYNNLITKVQQHPGMKVPCIDIYSIFKADKNPSRFYKAGDTHWSNEGMHVWLDLVNKEMKKWSNKQP